MTSAISYSKSGAAEATGMSEQTLDRAIKAGRLRAKRSGLTDDGEPTGKIVILATELETWLNTLADA